MFMPMLGSEVILVVVAFEVVIAEVEKVIFSWSLIGTTIQDGGTRERRDEKNNYLLPLISDIIKILV